MGAVVVDDETVRAVGRRSFGEMSLPFQGLRHHQEKPSDKSQHISVDSMWVHCHQTYPIRPHRPPVI